MTDRWFRIPETGDGSAGNPWRPDYVKSMGLDYAGNKTHPDGAPLWVARVYGTTTELDNLSAKPQVTEYGSVPEQELNQMLGLDRTESEWNNGFEVTQ